MNVKPGQSVHMMTRMDVLRVRWGMHRNEGRNVHELKLYTTDDLRKLYQEDKRDLVPLADGIVSRVQLVAEIRWRVWCARFSYLLLLTLSLIAAVAGVIAAVEGWPSAKELSRNNRVRLGDHEEVCGVHAAFARPAMAGLS